MQVFLCRFLCLAMMLTNVAGCGLPPRIPPPSENQRSQFGTVGVVSVKTPPEATLSAPVVGRGAGAALGAAAGAVTGALEGDRIIADMTSGCGSGWVCGIVLIPALAVAGVMVVGGTIVGAVDGAADAVPSETADQAVREIEQVLRHANPQASLRREVVLVARREGLSTVKEVSRSGPETIDQEPDYEAIRKQEIDTLLEVGVTQFGLVGRSGEGGSDPLLVFTLEASVRLVDTKTMADIYSRKNISEIRAARRFSEWSDNGAALLREEVDKIIVDTARKIIEEVFLTVR